MDKNYKAIKSDKLSKPYDDRFVIVDLEGNILDDAQGYGYKSIKNAYAAFAYKNTSKKDREKLEEKKKIVRKWCKEHKNFVKTMEEFAFEIAKGSWGPEDKFDTKFVKKCFEESGYTDLPFTASDFLKYWG